MPSGARKRQCRASVLGFVFTRVIDQLLWRMFAALFQSFSAISEAQISEPSILGQKITDTFFIPVPGGGRNQLSCKRFITFSNLDYLDFAYCSTACCPLSPQLRSTQYPRRSIYYTYLRRAVPTANGACTGEMASPSHESDSNSNSTTARTAAPVAV